MGLVLWALLFLQLLDLFFFSVSIFFSACAEGATRYKIQQDKESSQEFSGRGFAAAKFSDTL